MDYSMKNLAYYNGEIDEFENLKIPMSDRACFFGDGIYDATYSRNYKIFALNEHIDRFFNSAKLLDIKINQSKQQLKELLLFLVQKMDSGENFVYFQATRGSNNVRNHVYSNDITANILVNIYKKDIVDVYKKIKLISMEDTRFFHCNIKTINLIPSVMASKKASELGADETVFHRNGRVTECAHSNVHIIKNGCFITAPTDNLILPGIARAHLIKACKELGIPVKEIPYSIDELLNADEIIISSAGSLCLSAENLDGKTVGGKSPKLLKTLQDYVLNEFLTATE